MFVEKLASFLVNLIVFLILVYFYTYVVDIETGSTTKYWMALMIAVYLAIGLSFGRLLKVRFADSVILVVLQFVLMFGIWLMFEMSKMV